MQEYITVESAFMIDVRLWWLVDFEGVPLAIVEYMQSFDH